MRRRTGYYGKGFMMSRRGRAARTFNEHPVTYWTERLVMDEKQIAKLLVYMGNHHVGPNGKLIPFYRLPDKNDPLELANIFKEFHLVPAKKLNFIRIMSGHLQKSLDEKGKLIPASEQPRKKKKWKRFSKGKRRRRRKFDC
jgi:hypothetical protein